MSINTFLEDFGELRIESELENALRDSKRYRKSAKRAEKKVQKELDMDLNEKQKVAVDRAVSANNLCGSEYGREAYLLGLRDGLKFMTEISKVLQLEEVTP